MTRVWIVGLFATLSLAMVVGCGGSMTSPSGPPANLNGTWSGVLGQGSGGGRALRVTWTATQDGNHVSGPATVLTSPPVTDVLFSGTLDGTVSGGQVSLSLSAHPQQGTPDCTLAGSGGAAAATGTISGTLTVTFSSCGNLEPPSSSQLTLTRQ